MYLCIFCESRSVLVKPAAQESLYTYAQSPALWTIAYQRCPSTEYNTVLLFIKIARFCWVYFCLDWRQCGCNQNTQCEDRQTLVQQGSEPAEDIRQCVYLGLYVVSLSLSCVANHFLYPDALISANRIRMLSQTKHEKLLKTRERAGWITILYMNVCIDPPHFVDY